LLNTPHNGECQLQLNLFFVQKEIGRNAGLLEAVADPSGRAV
jgi:hypothetical protein